MLSGRSAGIHPGHKPVPGLYHFTLSYSDGESFLRPDPDEDSFWHVPMTREDFFEKLLELLSDQGLGTNENRSAKDHINGLKAKQTFKAQVRDQ